MNNQALAFIVSGMINELEQAIDAVSQAMPDGAERQKKELVYYTDKEGNEVTPSGNALFDFSHFAFAQRQTHYVDDPNGDYVALSPLYALLSNWIERMSLLEPTQEIEP